MLFLWSVVWPCCLYSTSRDGMDLSFHIGAPRLCPWALELWVRVLTGDVISPGRVTETVDSLSRRYRSHDGKEHGALLCLSTGEHKISSDGHFGATACLRQRTPIGHGPWRKWQQ